MQRLHDHYRTAFVTGASGGLGMAFASMLLEEGVRVWGTARDTSRLRELCKHGAFTPVQLDLDRQEDAVMAHAVASKEAGGFDIVVNNAGYGVFAPFSASEYQIWRKQLEAMLLTTAALAHAALQDMTGRRQGCLVNVASLAVDFPLPFMSGYNMAKAGLSALSESLIQETRGSGVVVVDFRPGDFRTAFNQAMVRGSQADSDDPRFVAAWTALEKNLNQAPSPVKAADALKKALLRRRSGTVRCGSFFQSTLAPLGARFLPGSLLRRIMAIYFS